MRAKKLIFGLMVVGVSQVAAAQSIEHFLPGPVVGIQGGYGRMYEGNGLEDWAQKGIFDAYSYLSATKKVNQWNYSGRAFVGYSINPYFGIEAGWQYYPREKYSASGTGLLSANSLDARVNMLVFDLVGKFNLPLEVISEEFEGYNIFIRAGGAYVKSRVSGVYSGSYGVDPTSSTSFEYVQNAIRPTYGAGISYNFNDNWAVEFAWTGIYGKSKLEFLNTPITETNPNPFQLNNADAVIPYANMFTIGFSYKFAEL